MQIKKKGLSLAMLSAVILSGCSAKDTLYTSGLEMQSDAMEEARETMTETAAEESVSEGTFDLMLSGPVQTGYVYVCGAVNNPGVYPVYEDMRVTDAIAAAGGFAKGADEEWLNLASYVSDGQKLYVYTLDETLLMKEEGISSAGDAGDQYEENAGQNASDGKVNINTASKEQLMSLPGIGEAKADLILQYRSEHGSFGSIEEIQNISGIKTGVFSKIKDMITV